MHRAVTRRAVTRRAWLLLFAGLLFTQGAHAQSTRYAETPADFDQKDEDKSSLWEGVLRPHRRTYEAYVNSAADLMKRRDDRSDDEAEDILQRAIQLAPAEPLAYWLLGTLQERREKWRACAATYGQLFALMPRLTDAEARMLEPEWALDMNLAICLAHIGEFERAISHHKRILGRGITDQPMVHARLGEAYMALGHLAEAIDALEAAYKLQDGKLRIAYALAVAYDRDEQEARARQMLDAAIRTDPRLDQLKAPSAEFTPASDELYYLGLAHAAQNKTEWAIAYFRHYLHITGPGPWYRRVRDHLADLEREPMPSYQGLEVRGTSTMDRHALHAAIAAAMEDLRECVKPVPGILFEVHITVTGRPAQRTGSRVPEVATFTRPASAPGIKAEILHSFATEPDPAATAQQCVETAAEKIALPQPAGGASQYMSVTFLLIGPTSGARPR